MKHLLGLCFAILGLSAGGNALAQTTFVQRVPLDPTRPYFVPTNPNVTVTVSFPHEIEGYDGFGFTVNAQQTQGDFVLTFTDGNSYLSFIPVEGREAVRNLNVVVRGQIISLITYPVKDQREAPTSIMFFDSSPGSSPAADQSQPSSVLRTYSPPRQQFESASPARLLGMIDTMKMLAQLDGQDTQEKERTGKRGTHLEDAARAMKHLSIARREHDVTDLGLYRITLTMVVRNLKLDAVAFTAIVENTCDRPITFDPESFGVRAGAAFYRQVIGDFQPLIPPGKSEMGFFVLAGGPDGRPNWLDPVQAFDPSLDVLSPKVNPGAALIKEALSPARPASPAKN